MLTVETIGRIRREHFIKGKTIKEIVRDLKVSRNTVRRVLRSGATSFEYERDVQPRPKLGRWTTDLENALAANARSRRLRNPEQLRRRERYRQSTPLKGVKIGRRSGVKFERRLTAPHCRQSC